MHQIRLQLEVTGYITRYIKAKSDPLHFKIFDTVYTEELYRYVENLSQANTPELLQPEQRSWFRL